MARRAPLLIGVDVGTSSCKSTVLTVRGRVLAEAAASYPTRRTAAGEVSQDPADWLRAMQTTLGDVVSRVDGAAVEAIGVTAPAHYAVLLDAARRPLGRVLLSSDGRPAQTAARLRERIGERFYELTGVALTAGWTLPQVRWILDSDPDMPPRLAMVLIAKDWIRAELTGVDATDPTDAAGTGMFDLRAGAWSTELLEAAGIGPDQVPPIRPSTSVGGTLAPTWARRLGLRSGIPVGVGATDTAAELVSVGAVEPGDAIIKIASTGTVVVVTDRPRPDRRLLTYPHAIAGRSYGAAATSTAATSDVWLRTVLSGPAGASGADLARDDARRLAARVPPGSDGLLFVPHLEGERSPYWDAHLRGAFLGLTSSHHRGHLYRAVLEGVAMSLRDCAEAMADAGLALVDPVLAGGGLRSPLWQRIVVDTLGVPARALAVQGPSIGAALLAGEAAGLGTVRRHGSTRRRRGTPIAPDPARARLYADRYRTYRDAVEAVTAVSHRLAEDASPA
jgi:xylulokinase